MPSKCTDCQQAAKQDSTYSTERVSPQANIAGCTPVPLDRCLEDPSISLAGAARAPAKSVQGRLTKLAALFYRLPWRSAGGHAGAALHPRHSKEHIWDWLLRAFAHWAAPCELWPWAPHHHGISPGFQRRAAVRTRGAACVPLLGRIVPGFP